MEISVLSFSLLLERLKGKLNGKTLCDIVKKSGFDCIDLMDAEILMYGESAIKKALAETNLKLGCLITSASFYAKPQKVKQQLSSALQQAKRLGAPILMVVPGDTSDEKVCGKLTKTELLNIAVRYFQEAVDLASNYGIQIGFENTPHHFKPLAGAEDCLYILERVKGLGLIYDTANMKVENTHADELAFYEKLKSYIIRVHLKDVVIGDFGKMERCADGQVMSTVLPGSGTIRVEEVIKRLKADGYQGGIAIEYMAPDISGDKHINMLKACYNYVRDCLGENRFVPPYCDIPGIEKPVSKIFYGTAMASMMLGKNTNAQLDAVYAQGINAFDCARGYGMAEKSLGKWIKDRGNREKIVVLTKCGNVGIKGVHIDRLVIEKELAKSLQTLQTDYIDIYLLHRDDPQTPVSEIIDTLNDALKQGKIKAFGASNWTHQRIQEANAYAASKGLKGFSVSSPNYGLAVQVNDPWGGECVTISGDENADARDWYTETQMPVLAYSSLARGFFSGKFRSFDEKAARKVLDNAGRKGYLHPCNMERLQRAEILAERKGCSVAQIAMRYIFASTMNVFALVSTSNPLKMKENIQAANNPLTKEEALWLEHGASC